MSVMVPPVSAGEIGYVGSLCPRCSATLLLPVHMSVSPGPLTARIGLPIKTTRTRWHPVPCLGVERRETLR